MLSPLILLITLLQLQSLIQSEVFALSPYNFNIVKGHNDDISELTPPISNEITDENETPNDIPIIKTSADRTEMSFKQPINSVNIDYAKNAIVLKFHKDQPMAYGNQEDDPDSLQYNFMRFGKRSQERLLKGNDVPAKNQLKVDRFERSTGNYDYSDKVGLRDSRGDNFMRFGRNLNQAFMRFGRNPGGDFMRFGRSPPQDYMRFGRVPDADSLRRGEDYMRLGRSPGQDFMRFGRSPGEDFMRFGRSPEQDFMRFGRSHEQDFMRFGRSPGEDFMRFGRSPEQDFMRFGRSSGQDARPNELYDNILRFGRSAPDFSSKNSPLSDKAKNHTSNTLPNNNKINLPSKLPETIDDDDSNPMDKAMQVLFSKDDKTRGSGRETTSRSQLSTEQDY